MRASWIALLVVLGSCSNKGDDSGSADDTATESDTDTDADADSDADADTDTDADSDSDNGDEVPDRPADNTLTGNLDTGTVMSDLDWAVDCYCWPATEDPNFTGAHVLYELDQPEAVTWVIRAKPDPGVDVSVYYMQRSHGYDGVPPTLNCGQVFDCDAQYDAQSDSNPGVGEVVSATGYNNYDTIIGVAGANGTSSGGFTVEIWNEQGIEP